MRTLPKTSVLRLPLVCVVLALLTVFALWPVRHNGFIRFDDDLYFYNNYVVQHGLTLDGFAWAFRTTEGGNWHPLTWISHMLDVELFGVNAGAAHLVNLLFHLLNTLLLLLLLRKMTGALWRSAFVAALFAVHPLHVESVAWIAERKDVLSAFFFFLTIWAYVCYVEVQNASGESRSIKKSRAAKGAKFYLLALILFGLGLLCKPMLVTLPFVLLLLDFWPLRRLQISSTTILNWKFLALEKFPFVALAVVSSVVTFLAQQSSGAMATVQQVGLSHRIGNALFAYANYLAKMVCPIHLVVLYPIQPLAGWKIAGAAILLIAISVVAWKSRKPHPFFLTGWLWFLGILVPVIGVVHVGSQSMADRYTYLPLIGVFITVCWGVCEIVRRRGIRVLLASAAIVASLVLTRAQVVRWHDSETLFSYALQYTENNVLIENNLAAEFISQGRIDAGIFLLQKTLAANPDMPNTLANLGSAYERKGDFNAAISCYERAIKLNPRLAEPQNNLGFCLLLQGDFDSAITHLSTALAIRPEFPEPHYNLGNIYFKQGQFAAAISSYQAAVTYRPIYPEAHNNLGYALFKTGKLEAALLETCEAVRQKPDFAQAYNNRAEVFLRLGKSWDAELDAMQATQLQSDSAPFHNVLGRAFAKQEKWPEAEIEYRRAIELQPTYAEAQFNLANTLLAQGKQAEARAGYETALHLQPDIPEAEMQLAMLFLRSRETTAAVTHLRNVIAQRPQWKEPLNNLAWLLATQSSLRNSGKEAIELALRAAQLSDFNDFSALDTLAAAYARDGQFKKAIDAAEHALAAARESRDRTSAAEIEARLVLYRQEKAFEE